MANAQSLWSLASEYLVSATDGCAQHTDLEFIMGFQRLSKIGGLAPHEQFVIVQNFLLGKTAILFEERQTKRKRR